MTETSTTTQTITCAPGHSTGSKPYIVPVLGNNARAVPQYIVYHGRDYLGQHGDVVRHPHWMTILQAKAAVAAHEEAVAR